MYSRFPEPAPKIEIDPGFTSKSNFNQEFVLPVSPTVPEPSPILISNPSLSPISPVIPTDLAPVSLTKPGDCCAELMVSSSGLGAEFQPRKLGLIIFSKKIYLTF